VEYVVSLVTQRTGVTGKKICIRDCAAPLRTGLWRPKKCLNCYPPDDYHGRNGGDKNQDGLGHLVRTSEIEIRGTIRPEKGNIRTSDGEKRQSNAERTRKRASSNQGKTEKLEGDDGEDNMGKRRTETTDNRTRRNSFFFFFFFLTTIIQV
jgi:hypothetical protein